MPGISEVAEAINDQFRTHSFAEFLELRMKLKGKKRQNRSIYNTKNNSVHERDGWAFHTGGSGELQFNIAFEHAVELRENRFRFGVAFELKTNRNVPSIEPILAKMARFNKFIRANKSQFMDYRMWVWRGSHIVTLDSAVREITSDEMVSPNFIVMGKTCSVTSISIPTILDTFSDLLPVYEFVEGNDSIAPEIVGTSKFDQPFNFAPYLSPGRYQTERTVILGTTDVDLKSARIRELLVTKLQSEGHAQLGQEIASGNGGRIDIVSKLVDGGYQFYEIKPAETARQAIREALPQLLEYSYRRGGMLAADLVIVSQAKLDKASLDYLERLREMGLPVSYIQIPLD